MATMRQCQGLMKLKNKPLKKHECLVAVRDKDDIESKDVLKF